METLMEVRKCQECGAKLVGRADQKYCDAMCKTSANNRKRSEQLKNQPECIITIQKTLLNNYRILNDLRKRGEQFSKLYLQDLGFSFRHMTGAIEQGNTILYYCFNQPYILLNDRLILFGETS